MEVTYRRDKEHNYMIVKAPEEMQGSEYQVRMLLLNEIPGLLRCKLRTADGVSYLYYEVTSRQPLARIFDYRAAGYEDIRALALAVGRALEEIEKYLLTDDGMILEPEFIYMDVETREISFCYLPFCREDFAESFRSLAEYLLKKLNHEDEQAVLWGYQLYSGTMEENYSVSAVIEGLRRRPEKRIEKGEETEIETKTVVERVPEKSGEKEICRANEAENRLVQGMITGQEKLKKRAGKKRAVWAALAALLYLMGVGALAVFHILTLTQAGGILFLTAGVVYYLCAGRKEGREREKGKSLHEEEKTGRSGRGRREKKSRRKPGKSRRRGKEFGKEPDGREWERKEKTERKKSNRNKQEGNEKRNEKRKENRSRREPDIIEPEENEELTGEWEEDTPQEDEICDFSEEPSGEIYGQTTLLQGGVSGQFPVLISSNPEMRENIVVNKEKFIIGKMKGQADMILNLPVISRIHAAIERRDDGYFLVDLNSTNGTCLNGERLEANEYRRIHTGDEIIFAGAGYYFKE